MIRLDEYSDTLLGNIRRFIEIGDIHGAEIIQGGCVGCLAYLAVLCDLLGRLEPNSKPQMDAVCDSSLERLGHLTQEMDFEEYTYLDLLVKVRHPVGHKFLTVKKVIMTSMIRFRGKSRWSCSIHGSITYRMRKVNRYDAVGKSLQRRGRTLKSGFQDRPLRKSPGPW